MRQLHLTTAIVAALLAVAGPAQGLTLTYEFEGVVTTLLRDGGLFGAPGTVQIGDGFTGHFRYEVGAANPDQLPADGTRGAFELIDLVIDQSVLPPFAPLGVLVTHEPGLPTIPPTPPDLGSDALRVVASSVVFPTLSLRLFGPFGSAYTDDSLPVSLDLADFPDGAFVQGLTAISLPPFPNIEDVGVITSLRLVPEPGTLVLVAVGLAGLAHPQGKKASSAKYCTPPSVTSIV